MGDSANLVRQLKMEIEELTAARNDVQTRVDAALTRNEVIKPEVHAWLATSAVVAGMAAELNVKAHSRRTNTLLKTICTCSRSSLIPMDREEFGVTQAAIQDALTKKRAFRGTVSDELRILSRDQTENRITEALRDDEISIVGIYGMAGVGKTVLLNSLYQHLKRNPSYDHVVSVTISKHPDWRRVQDILAWQLDLQLKHEDSTSLRAKLLLEKVNNDKVLVFIDDLWDKMDLAQVGIPSNNCKIVFTTRSLTVCDLMKAQRKFEVDALSEVDSLRLFKTNAGDAPDPTLVTDIVKECKGVPLVIVILGRALRGKDKFSWMDTLRRLKEVQCTSPISTAIQVSYDFLPLGPTRMCFLFCCLFPEDFRIPCATLLNYVVGENLIPNVHTLEEIRTSLDVIIVQLTSLGLLLKLDQDCIMMHDIVRDMAIRIGFCSDNAFLVKAGMGMTEWPTMSLARCKRMSMMHNKLMGGVGGSLPTQVYAPKLSTLSLYGNKDLKEIPDDFFYLMTGLLTLDLSETCIVSLPQSFACLRNLRTLCIDHCYYLNNITSIQDLQKLEILTLSHTQMQRLPEEIRSLTSLKLLDLSKAPNLVTISPRILSNLSLLEQLDMKDSFSQWEAKDNKNGRNVTLSEITTLKHLSCLRLCVTNLECLSQEMLQHWTTLKKFEILFGSIVSSSSP